MDFLVVQYLHDSLATDIGLLGPVRLETNILNFVDFFFVNRVYFKGKRFYKYNLSIVCGYLCR